MINILKMKVKSPVFQLFALVSLLSISLAEDTLFFTLTHFRHGARAPIFPSESESDDYGMKWTNPGELTLGGHRMHYLLGVYNRKRYIPKLLPEKFDPHDIYIISSNYNRTVQSALSQLQGLYPKDTSNKLNDIQKKYSIPELSKSNIDAMQPEIDGLGDAALPDYINLIPVHIYSDSEMRYRLFDNPKCKAKAKELMKPNDKNEVIVNRINKFNQEWKPYFEKFFTGDKAKEYDYETLEVLADLFITDISEGFEFTEFKNKTNLTDDQMEELYKYFVEFVGRTMNDYQYGDTDGKLIKLDMSPLFRELIEYIKRRINREADIQEGKKIDYRDYSVPKFVMVSGHDSMISVMLLFLGLMDGDRQKFWHVPVYAANIAFEVYNKNENYSRDDYSQYEIRVLFNGEQIEGAVFTLKDFIDKYNKIAWNSDQMAEFCGYKETKKEDEAKDDKNNILIYVLGGIAALFLILCIIFIILWRSKKISSDNVEAGGLLTSTS